MKIFPSISASRKGFTLVELMVATGLASVVLLAFGAGFIQHRRVFHHKNLEQEMQQNVRTAMMFLQRDLRYAGSGLVMGTQNLDQWFGLPSTVQEIPWIVDGGTDSDELIVIGISGEPVAELTAFALEGQSEIQIEIRDPAILPYIPMVGDVLVLAGIEAVIVNQVKSPTRLTVSRDPSIQNVGLHLIYPPETDVFQLNVIRYRVATVDGVPSLLREDSRYTYDSDEDRVVADGIERFKANRSGNVVEIELTGRSRRPVPGIAAADSLLRYTLASSNRVRNTNPRLSIQGWPSDMLFAIDDDIPDNPPPGDGETGDGETGGGETGDGETGGDETGGDEYTGPPGQNPNRKKGGKK